MSARPAILLLLAAAVAAAEPELAISLREISYAQRVEYILGDGARPFADEDQRRAVVQLDVKASGSVALLGWGAFAITEAVSDHGEALAMAGLPDEGVFATAHDLRANPVAPLPPIPLPLTRKPCAGLAKLSGSIELRFSREPFATLRIPVAELAPNVERSIPGIEGGTFALSERPGGDGRVLAHFNPAAYLALQDLAFFDAKGVELPIRNRRVDWRDNQGQLTVFARSQPAAVEVRFYRHVERRVLPLAFTDLAFGLTLPGRDDLRGPTRTGADGF